MKLDNNKYKDLIDVFLSQKRIVKRIQNDLINSNLDGIEYSKIQNKFANEFDKYIKLSYQINALQKDNPDILIKYSKKTISNKRKKSNEI